MCHYFFRLLHLYCKSIIKKLFLLAISNNQSIPCISLTRDGSAEVNDLQEGMPNNSIIDESIKLYQQEIDGVL